jgi:hypothetical protein
MARYTGPKSKIARKFKEPIFGPDKALEKKTTLQDNMVYLKKDLSNLSTLFSCKKSKKQNILTVF